MKSPVDLRTYNPEHIDGAVPVQHGNGLIMGATILIVLRAFANGGSSLTGVEAISNTVNAFRKPEGINARRVLTIMAVRPRVLAGRCGLAGAHHPRHPLCRRVSVDAVRDRPGGVRQRKIGKVFYFLVQAATALILYTGGNTSFNGFPALASFVAEDSFLPRPLMKRGHRLVFSNGIITLTVLAVALLIATGGSLNALVPFYAIGVFTGFSMAGYGMTKHWLTHRGPGWRYKLVINLSAGILSTIVVGIFAIAKFTEGAWLVVVVFPILVFASDAAEPAVPRRGIRVGDVAHRASRLGTSMTGTGCSSSWTASTSPRSRRCATRKGCTPTSWSRCTSCWTRLMPSGCSGAGSTSGTPPSCGWSTVWIAT